MVAHAACMVGCVSAQQELPKCARGNGKVITTRWMERTACAPLAFSHPKSSRKTDHRTVMVWERLMREEEGKEATTVRWRLAALSSLFAHGEIVLARETKLLAVGVDTR